jgi:phage tail sheath protein FI
MAETLISPGVLARENDQSQITSQPVQAGAAIIGPTVKGKPYIPTVVTSYSEYLATFGSTFISASNEYSFLTSISAFNYFQNGGSSLLVTRVTSGSFTPATSSQISNNESVTGGIEATGSREIISAFTDGTEARITYSGTVYRFIASADPIPQDDVDGNLYFFSTGSSANMTANNLKNEINSALSGALASASLDLLVATTSSATLILSASAVGTAFNGITLSTGSGASFATQITLAGGVNGVGSSNAFTLETLGKGEILNSTSTEGTNGDLASGSIDNLRWEIVNPNTSSGVFSVVIRRGNDLTKSKSVLETFTNVSLDPKASNYVARVIGDQTQNLMGSGTSEPYLQTSGSYVNASRYVRVKSVASKTPDYLDNNGSPKSQFTSSIPTAQSGTFGDAAGSILTGTGKYYADISNSDTQGLVGANYTDAINLLANKDDYKYNVISCPGLVYENGTHATPLNTLISNIEGRGDAIIVMDLKNYGATVVGATTTAASLDTSYASSYWPWVMVTDPDSQQLVWVPASTMIPGVYSANDRSAEAWFAPAGINRGGLGSVRQAERKLTQSNRDTLYVGKVNPIATFPGRGVVVFGQKTLQAKPSALDRVNVRRLLIALKNYISQIADTLVFEQNTMATRNNFLTQVNPYLESVQQRQGLYAFKVVMDGSNNTADVIDRNELIGAIYIQPTKTAEFIYLDFNILPTGATFPA